MHKIVCADYIILTPWIFRTSDMFVDFSECHTYEPMNPEFRGVIFPLRPRAVNYDQNLLL
jgi:hypothetical protein